MENQDFTTILLVDKSPEEAFNAINNVCGWWSEEIECGTSKLDDEFKYHYEDVHSCKMKLVEVVPEYGCYDICKGAWTGYIQNSLRNLITTGKGQPNSTGNPQTEDEKKLISEMHSS